MSGFICQLAVTESVMAEMWTENSQKLSLLHHQIGHQIQLHVHWCLLLSFFKCKFQMSWGNRMVSLVHILHWAKTMDRIIKFYRFLAYWCTPSSAQDHIWVYISDIICGGQVILTTASHMTSSWSNQPLFLLLFSLLYLHLFPHHASGDHSTSSIFSSVIQHYMWWFFMFSGYFDHLHREGNNVIIVHCSEIPSMPTRDSEYTQRFISVFGTLTSNTYPFARNLIMECTCRFPWNCPEPKRSL